MYVLTHLLESQFEKTKMLPPPKNLVVLSQLELKRKRNLTVLNQRKFFSFFFHCCGLLRFSSIPEIIPRCAFRRK